jgi:hypothetical protein
MYWDRLGRDCTVVQRPETVFKEKHGVWDSMPELTITSPYVNSNICTMGNPLPESTFTYARVDFIPQSEAKNLASGILETFHG